MWAKETTTTELAKAIFKVREKREVQDKTSFLTKRIRKLVKLGLVIKSKNGTSNKYCLQMKNFLFGMKIKNQTILASLD